MSFLSRIFKRKKSKDRAKERLQLLLVQDRINLSPELVDAMRQDIIEVISRYIEVDQEEIEINLKKKDERTTLMANIPVKQIKR